MSRPWRLVATSDAGTTRSVAVPRLISASGRRGDVQEGGTSRGDGLQRRNILTNDVRRQLSVVDVDRIMLSVGHEPIQQVDEGGALGLVGLILVEHQPTVAGDRGTGLPRRIDAGERAGRNIG